LSADGRLLAAGGCEYDPERFQFPGRFTVWELASGREVRTGDFPDRINSMALAPGGALLAFTTQNIENPSAAKNDIVLRDVLAGKDRPPLVGHKSQVSALAFTPDSRTLISIDKAATICLWDPAAGKQRAAFPPDGHHGSDISRYVAFTPDTRLLATSTFL